ncbi:hypothetical protein [Sporosarcina highlanderae]|uniref:Uncharacterized protein n=1 Tax=Sporosarcina highlanderae TaxID=3035916 RepID=A0ABT8JYB7_9BACL|nr:hypothetical protein [Sporosarcina highlanderae]MDN4609134.1 hypothetical protein [Sporosarcina highlanderae]
MVTALCDHCGKINDVEFKEKSHPNEIRETYFTCEHCYYHYTSFVTDKKVRQLQRKRAKSTVVEERVLLFEQIGERMSLLKYNLVNYGRADL